MSSPIRLARISIVCLLVVVNVMFWVFRDGDDHVESDVVGQAVPDANGQIILRHAQPDLPPNPTAGQ